MPARKPKPKPLRGWMLAPTPGKPADATREEVETRARELIDQVFRPRHIQPPPENARYNYITDIVGRWHRGFYHFASIYACPRPDATSPSFESPFARLRYVAPGEFGLAYMRHTGKWCEVYASLTLDEAFTSLREEMQFWPLS